MDDDEVTKTLNFLVKRFDSQREWIEKNKGKIRKVLSVLSNEELSTNQIVNRCDIKWWVTVRTILDKLRDFNVVEKNDKIVVISWRLKRRRL